MNPDTRRQARLWLAIVFLLGAGIGVVAGYTFAHKSYAATNAPTMSEPERRAKRVAEMTQEIGLTPEQSKKVDGIIATAHEDMKKVHDQSDAQMDAIREKARNEIRESLTTEQKPKYEAFVKKIDEERKKMAEHR